MSRTHHHLAQGRRTRLLIKRPDHYTGWAGENCWEQEGKRFVRKQTIRAMRRISKAMCGRAAVYMEYAEAKAVVDDMFYECTYYDWCAESYREWLDEQSVEPYNDYNDYDDDYYDLDYRYDDRYYEPEDFYGW